MKTNLKKFLPLALMLSMLTWGCAQTQTAADTTAKTAVATKQQPTVYKGKIVGMSKKAKTISIQVGKGDKAKTIMVKFDSKTKGTKYANKGEAAIIVWEKRGNDQYATVVKPKLAKLPEGVTEIKPKEMKKLLDKNTAMVLVDSRPSKRYAQSHLPTAISIPVAQFKAKAPELLPKDKDMPLVFYCGGPT
jgi:predicted sulfurtransferase